MVSIVLLVLDIATMFGASFVDFVVDFDIIDCSMEADLFRNLMSSSSLTRGAEFLRIYLFRFQEWSEDTPGKNL